MTTPSIEKDAAPPAGAANPAAVRAQLDALRTRDGYGFVDLAYRYLSVVDSDVDIVASLVAILVELGLGGPARDVLRKRSELEHSAIDVAALRRVVSGTPTGRVPWTELRNTFDANLRALRPHHRHLADVAKQIGALTRSHQLFRDRFGHMQLLRSDARGIGNWIPGFVPPAPEFDGETGLDAPPDAMLVIGFSLCDWLEQVWKATPSDAHGRAKALYVVDEEMARFMAWLHTGDRRAVLDDQRVMLHVGGDALEQYVDRLVGEVGLPLPPVRLTCSSPASVWQKCDEASRRAQSLRDGRQRSMLAAIARRAEVRGTAGFERLQPGARVLGVTSQFTTMLQYSMRDIGDAFTELGYEFKLAIEPTAHHRSSGLTATRIIHDFDPDLIVMINHFRRELPEPMAGVPVLTWIQDPTEIVFSPETGASIGPLDFVCGYYIEDCTREFGYPEERFQHTPLPVSTRVFHSGPVPDAAARRFEADVMYVGHLHMQPDELLEHWHRQSIPAFHPMLDRIAHEVIALHRAGKRISHVRHAHPIVRASAGAHSIKLTGEQLESLSAYFAFRLFDVLYRRETLAWLAEWVEENDRTLRIYGRGWSEDPRLAAHAMGPIKHGEELRQAFGSSRLSVQTMPGGFRHQRVYEALASGCLVIARYAPGDFAGQTLEEYRAAPRVIDDPKKMPSASSFSNLDQIMFRDSNELRRVIERYLDHPDEYRARRDEHRASVMRTFRYASVISRVLDRMRLVGDQADARSEVTSPLSIGAQSS